MKSGFPVCIGNSGIISTTKINSQITTSFIYEFNVPDKLAPESSYICINIFPNINGNIINVYIY